MTLEDRVMTLYAQSNPFPSADDLGLVAEEATEYLATLDSRSSEVTQLKTKQEDRTKQQRPVMPWLAAALAIIVAGVAFILLTDDQTGEVANTPTTIAESAPTSLATPTTVVESAFADVPVLPIGIGLGEGGQFQPTNSVVPFALTVPKGWIGGDQTPDRLAVCFPHQNEFNPTCHIAKAPAVAAVLHLDAGSVEETRQFLATFPGAEFGEIEEVSIGGADGIRFEFAHEVTPVQNTDPQPSLRIPLVIKGDMGQEFPLGGGPLDKSIVSIVDVNGVIMTLVYQGDAREKGATRDGFLDHLEEGMAIVDSIVWGDLS